jgi:hypothetical protein
MPRRYSFDYTALTIGDARDIIERQCNRQCCPFSFCYSTLPQRGCIHDPYVRVAQSCSAIPRRVVAYMKSLEDADVSDAMRLLKSMFGEGQSNA